MFLSFVFVIVFKPFIMPLQGDNGARKGLTTAKATTTTTQTTLRSEKISVKSFTFVK